MNKAACLPNVKTQHSVIKMKNYVQLPFQSLRQ